MRSFDVWEGYIWNLSDAVHCMYTVSTNEYLERENISGSLKSTP